MKTNVEMTIGEIVAHDYRTAATFSKYGIDFCCRGHRSIAEVCLKEDVSSEQLLAELDGVIADKRQETIDYKTWPLDLLADYVEKRHHRYIEEKTPVLLQFLDKLCRVHGKNHPELFEVKELFALSAEDLEMHLRKEERILFPFVRKMVNAQIEANSVDEPLFGSVKNPIAMMMEEHDHEGERFRKIAAITDNYTPPADACTTYKTTYAMLQEFENDLHKHIHLENNILFPEAVALEAKVG